MILCFSIPCTSMSKWNIYEFLSQQNINVPVFCQSIWVKPTQLFFYIAFYEQLHKLVISLILILILL
jgi:hypothetical protein